MARRSSIGTLAIHLGHPTASLIGPQNYFPTHKRSEQISISDDIQASLWTGISSICSTLEEEGALGHLGKQVRIACHTLAVKKTS